MRDRKNERPKMISSPGTIVSAADYDRVKAYITKLEADGATHMHKFRAEPRTKDTMMINNIYLVESFASRLASILEIEICQQDLMFLLWIRDYEYVSRSYITKTLGFPSHHASYKFLKRLANNGFVNVVRTRHIGIHNGSAFHITAKGEELAIRIYNALKNGNSSAFSH